MSAIRVEAIETRAYTVPTDATKSDGTAAWIKTIIVVDHARGGGREGLGCSYADVATADLAAAALAPIIIGRDVMDPPGAWRAMQRAVRNLGRAGIAATAISAVDTALWDLKAKLVEVPLALLLGWFRDQVPIYGSGGFSSYDDTRLAEQLAGWVEKDGCRWVKMKIGTDPARVAVAKRAIGAASLFVDANGALAVKQAMHLGRFFALEYDLPWFEEPVSSDNLDGLRRVRDHVPAPMEVAAGEYGYEPNYFLRMLSSGAVDVLQTDATRCGGVTGFMLAAAPCEAFAVDLSPHCAPTLHCHLGCAAPRLRRLQWFHDHVHVEQMLFDGAPVSSGGAMAPDRSRPGWALEFKRQDAEAYRN